jgi:hypothetical protein
MERKKVRDDISTDKQMAQEAKVTYENDLIDTTQVYNFATRESTKTNTHAIVSLPFAQQLVSVLTLPIRLSFSLH